MKRKSHIPSDGIQIDRNVPIPKAIVQSKYPWNGMKIGDSFYASNVSARSAAIKRGQVFKEQYITRREGKGFRVWRVK